jgi:hypothetical protein
MPWRRMGERRHSSYSYLTSAPDGGEWSASRPGRALPPGPIRQEVVWAPESVWTQELEEKSSASVGDRTPVVQSVVSHYTDWATPPQKVGTQLLLLEKLFYNDMIISLLRSARGRRFVSYFLIICKNFWSCVSGFKGQKISVAAVFSQVVPVTRYVTFLSS